MIVEAICNVLFYIVLGIIKLFPTIPEIDMSFLDGVVQVLSLIDTFVSLRVVTMCLITIFVFMNIHTFWSAIMWVVRKLPIVK